MYQCGNFWCRVGLGTAVLNGIEAALWDLKGKLLGLPVYQLLGGRKHDRLLATPPAGRAIIRRTGWLPRSISISASVSRL